MDSISISLDGDLFYPEALYSKNYSPVFDGTNKNIRLSPFLFTWAENADINNDGYYKILPDDQNGNEKYIINQNISNRIGKIIDNYLVLVTPNQTMQVDDIIVENQTYSIDAESMVLNESYNLRGSAHDWIGNSKLNQPSDDQMFRNFDNLSTYKLSSLKFESVKQYLYYDVNDNVEEWNAPFVDMSLSIDYNVQVNNDYLNSDVDDDSILVGVSKTELNPSQTLNLTLVDDNSQEFNYMKLQKDLRNELSKLIGAKILVTFRKDSWDFFNYPLPTQTLEFIVGIDDAQLYNSDIHSTYTYETLERNYTQDGTPTFTISYSIPAFQIKIKDGD